MISNWASGHHAKLTRLSRALCIKDNTLRGLVTMARVVRVWGSSADRSRGPGSVCTRGGNTGLVYTECSLLYTRWCEGNLKQHNGPASLVSKQSLCCRLLQLATCTVTRTDFYTKKKIFNQSSLLILLIFLPFTFWVWVDVLLNISISGLISAPTDAALAKKKNRFDVTRI